MARGRRERELKRSRITVIGEGLTERWYFEHLRNIKGFRYDCKPRFFSQQSYAEMSKLIEQVLQNGGIAVCICDADVTRSNENERKRFEKIRQTTRKTRESSSATACHPLNSGFCYITLKPISISITLKMS